MSAEPEPEPDEPEPGPEPDRRRYISGWRLLDAIRRQPAYEVPRPRRLDEQGWPEG